MSSTVSVPHPETRKRTTAKIPPEVWKWHKETIYRLYISEDHDLKSVMRTMQTDFGLVATEKMWKTQLRKWAYFKNLPSTVTLLIKQSRQEHATAFDSSCHFLDGQRLPPETVARACVRRDRRSPTAKKGSPVAPPPCKSLVYLEYAESALRAIRAYTDASHTTWTWDGGAQLYLSAKGGVPGRLRLSQFHDSLLFVATFLSQSADTRSCSQLMCTTLASLDTILADEDPLLVGEVLNILAQMQGQAALQSYFIRRLAGTAARVLGPGHHLTYLFQSLEASDASSRTEFLYCALKAQVSELTESLGSDTKTIMMTVINIHMHETSRLLNPKDGAGPDTKGISTLATRAGKTPASPTGIHLQFCAARRFLCLNKLAETREIIDDVLQREACQDVISKDPQLAYGFFLLLGHLRWKECRREEAERHIREALENAETGGVWGLWLEGLAQLEVFLRSFGEDQEADAVRGRLEQALTLCVTT